MEKASCINKLLVVWIYFFPRRMQSMMYLSYMSKTPVSFLTLFGKANEWANHSMAIGLSVDGTTTGEGGGCNCRTHVQNSHSPFLSRPVLKFPRLKEHSTVSFMYNTMYIRKALRCHQFLTIFVLYTSHSQVCLTLNFTSF